jgi:hypothetical protein
VQHLVRAVAGNRPGLERQLAGVADVELAARPALSGHGDHLGVEVHADRAGPPLGQLGDRAATAAAGVDHGSAGDVAEQLVGTCAQLDGHGLRVDGIEDSKQTGHVRHART